MLTTVRNNSIQKPGYANYGTLKSGTALHKMNKDTFQTSFNGSETSDGLNSLLNICSMLLCAFFNLIQSISQAIFCNNFVSQVILI